MSATPETGHLHSKDGHRVLLLTSGSFIRRVLYYNVYIFFYTLPTKNKFITYNTLQNLTIFFYVLKELKYTIFFRMFLLYLPTSQLLASYSISSLVVSH